MRTPRHTSRPGSKSGRGFGTLIGNGWLREAPPQDSPRGWDVRSRSALRKCMFMQMPPEVAEFVAHLPPPSRSPVPAWQPPAREEQPIVPHRRDPRRDVRAMPAVDPAMVHARASLPAEPRAWWEDPIALGSLLVVAPPIGLACVWRSKNYSTDARWALTVMSVLVTCFAFSVVLALLVVR